MNFSYYFVLNYRFKRRKIKANIDSRIIYCKIFWKRIKNDDEEIGDVNIYDEDEEEDESEPKRRKNKETPRGYYEEQDDIKKRFLLK